MKKLMATFALAGALAGCGKEDFSDPQEFAEHYGQELLGEYFKEGMELMAYKGFEFSDAKVGIDKNGREYVSAQVSLTVPRGEYHRRLKSQPATDILKTWPSDRIQSVARREDALAINEAYRKARRDDRAPVVYSADCVDIKKLVSPWSTIRIIRLKDGEGVYRPAGDVRQAIEWYDANGNETSRRYGIPNEPFYAGSNGLLSEKAIKQLGAVKEGTPEAAQAHEAYVRQMKELNAAIEKLNACCVTQAEVLATASSYATTNALPNWIWERQQKAASTAQAAVAEARNKASAQNRKAKDAVRNANMALQNLNSQAAKAEKNLARAKKDLESATAQLERLTSGAEKSRRNSHAVAKAEQVRERVTTSGPKAVADAEAALADLKGKIQSAEAALAKAKAQQTKAAEEGQSAIAQAEADGKTALSQTTEKLQGEYQQLKQKSEAELKAAIEDCKRKLGLSK